MGNTIPLEELKAQLFIENAPAYDRYDLFRQRVIDPAILEVCNYTDLLVAYEPKRKDRKIISLIFYTCDCRISRKEHTQREINRTTALDNLPAEIAPPRKMPTVGEIQEEREKQRKAAEQDKMIKKNKRAKSAGGASMQDDHMSGQGMIEDLI